MVKKVRIGGGEFLSALFFVKSTVFVNDGHCPNILD